MTRARFMAVSIVAGLIIGLGLGMAQTAAAGGSKNRVTSVQVSAGKLILKADGKSLSFEGTYTNAKGRWVKFDGGKAVAVLGDDGREQRIRETKIHREAVILVTYTEYDMPLGDGTYQGQDPTQPRDPQPIPQNPNSFEVRNGKIVSVWIGGSI